MALRSSFTRVFGAVIPSAWANSIRDHLVTIATSNDVASEGQLCVNTSTDQLVVHNGSGAVELARYGAGSSFTATFSQGFGVSSTNSEVGYQRFGRWIVGHITASFTSNGSTGVQISMTTNLPQPAAPVRCGDFLYVDSGTAYYDGSMSMNTSGVVAFYCHNSATQLGSAPSFAIIAGDTLYCTFGYYAAS